MIHKTTLSTVLAFLGLFHGSVQAQTPQDGLVETLTAVKFPTKSVGGTSATLDPSRDWNLWSNGYIETTVAIPNDDPATRATGSPHTFSLTAYGSVAGGVWPSMDVTVDGVKVKTFTVGTTAAASYNFTTNVRAGMRKVRLSFTNDAIIGGADRNLFVRDLKISGPDISAQLPATAGTFPLQSISILGGFYPRNTDWFSTTTPCPSTLAGCRNIDFVKGVGGNDVTLTSTCVIQPGVSWCAPQINWNDEETALRVAIRYARSKGLSVTLKPFVLAPSPYGDTVLASAQWTPAIPSQFFDSIEANLKHHAQIAREEGVSLLMLGAEMGGAITSAQAMNGNCARWQQLIANVRAQAAAVSNPPAGSPSALKLTYSPTLAGFWNYPGSNEAPYVCFWDRLDYIGLNAYPHMNFRGANASATPTVKVGSGWNAYKRLFNAANVNSNLYDDLAIHVNYALAPQDPDYDANFNFAMPSMPTSFSTFDLARTDADSYRVRYNSTQYSTKWYADYVIDGINDRFKASLVAQGRYPLKAILTEVGASSSYTAQGFWGEVPDAAAYQPSWATYVDEQASGWDGYLRAFRGDPRIQGISVWGLNPYHDRLYSGWGPDWYSGFDFNGKLNASGQQAATEERICKWFKRGWANVSPCAQP